MRCKRLQDSINVYVFSTGDIIINVYEYVPFVLIYKIMFIRTLN